MESNGYAEIGLLYLFLDFIRPGIGTQPRQYRYSHPQHVLCMPQRNPLHNHFGIAQGPEPGCTRWVTFVLPKEFSIVSQ